MDNTVKIVCPQCTGTGHPCARVTCVAPQCIPSYGVDNRIFSAKYSWPHNHGEGTYCEGKGWIWATRWEER